MEADTIVALSTPPGRGALAVVRISGAATRAVLAALAPGLPEPAPERRPVLTRIVDPAEGGVLDRGLVTLFPGPASYTGEDLAELSVHGGPLLSMLVVEACVAAGAREAAPGEFTRRAYLNGKLDLVQAEAVADLVDAESPALHRAAVHQMEGGLSARLAGLREGLVDLEALLVHHLDFPDEDEPPVAIDEVARRGEATVEELDRLLETAPEGELLREGAVAVLAGRPNAGKSSLYNALLGEERAIVTAQPGTTRDALESRVSLGGFPFRVVDTAGLRERAEEVERMGIEVARRYLSRADVVLLCLPVDEPWGAPEERFLEGLETDAPVVIVRTCADREEGGGEAAAVEAGGEPAAVERGGETPSPAGETGRTPAGELRVSVRTGEGLDDIRTTLRDLVFRGVVRMGAEAPVLTRRRQREGVREARDEVRSFARALRDGVPAEAAAAHLRSAETSLEEILGIISPEEILDRVFARFCIGK